MNDILSKADIKAAIKNTFFSKFMLTLGLFFCLTFVSALGLIYVKSLYRHYFIKLQEIEKTRDALHTEWTQLLLEESTWASHARISKIATQELGMKDPDPDEIQIIIPRPPQPVAPPQPLEVAPPVQAGP